MVVMFLFSCLIFLSLQFLKRETKERKAKEARETRKKQGCATRCSLAEEMERYSLATFLHSLSLFPPSLSISYIKICHILSQNVKYGIFVANVTKTEHTRYEEIILGRILCEKAPQVVLACINSEWI